MDLYKFTRCLSGSEKEIVMKVDNKFGPKFEIDSYINESEIKKLEMKPLDNQGTNYELYSKGFFVYFFKRVEGNKLQLLCCTSKESYYFSGNHNIGPREDKVGLLDWLFG